MSNRRTQLQRGRGSRPEIRTAADGGFTLVEVIVAVGIAVGMLILVLSIHSQIARARAEALREMDYLRSVRLVMSQMTTELRSAVRDEYLGMGFAGSSNAISFATLSGGELDPSSGGGIQLVRYELRRMSTNSAELVRTVTGPSSAAASPAEPSSLDELGATNAPLADLTNAPPGFEAPPESSEELWQEPAQTKPAFSTRMTVPLGFAHFRFWSGSTWLESWPGPELPSAVEMSLGRDALPEEGLEDEFAEEVFRRIIYVPASRSVEGVSTNAISETPEVL